MWFHDHCQLTLIDVTASQFPLFGTFHDQCVTSIHHLQGYLIGRHIPMIVLLPPPPLSISTLAFRSQRFLYLPSKI